MKSSAAFRVAMQRVTIDEIKASLPTDSVLLDFLEFESNEETHILASVIRPDKTPKLLDLGPGTIVGQRIDAWRKTFGISPEGKKAGKLIREQIWEPLLAHIGDAKTILISPDGVLGRLPFAALPGRKEGTYLIEDHRIAMIPVPQLLPALVNDAGKRELKRDLLLMGDVDYDKQSKADDATKTKKPRRRPGSHKRAPSDQFDQWGNLQYSGQEVDAISGLYRRNYNPPPEAIVELRKSAATEQAFRKSAPDCLYLHLATHGFFAKPEFKSALSSEAIAEADRASRNASFSQEQRSVVRGYSPGQLSGLVFAGANNPTDEDSDEDSDDGIMTSDEIAFLPLGGVRLAVLSACQTGLGESAGGEGLLGVQRAFQVSGVDTTIATLWSVNDPATSRFMQEFYKNHFENEMSTLDALRQAQLWALNNPDAVPRASLNIPTDPKSKRLSPKYWAPFVLSGDWR